MTSITRSYDQQFRFLFLQLNDYPTFAAGLPQFSAWLLSGGAIVFTKTLQSYSQNPADLD
ncbi:hypothetical protein H6F95_06065 [Cyanobacteria bacterium FACHB-471]|nr:hypothetical protein [Cyanobacteria bacterium FACHB-471]